MLSCLDFTKAANSSWQVVVRMRPLNTKEEAEEATNVVQKLSSNSLLISEQQFTFDAVIGEDASQVLKHFTLSLSFAHSHLLFLQFLYTQTLQFLYTQSLQFLYKQSLQFLL